MSGEIWTGYGSLVEVGRISCSGINKISCQLEQLRSSGDLAGLNGILVTLAGIPGFILHVWLTRRIFLSM